jgi:hypothetical protein
VPAKYRNRTLRLMSKLMSTRLRYVLQAHVMIQNGVNDQHVRELQCEDRVRYGRAEAADQVRGSLACSVHGSTLRRRDERRQVNVSVTV